MSTSPIRAKRKTSGKHSGAFTAAARDAASQAC